MGVNLGLGGRVRDQTTDLLVENDHRTCQAMAAPQVLLRRK